MHQLTRTPSTASYPASTFSSQWPSKQRALGTTRRWNWYKRSEDVVTGDVRETTYLFQQLSIALQRGNSVSFQSTFTTSYPVATRYFHLFSNIFVPLLNGFIPELVMGHFFITQSDPTQPMDGPNPWPTLVYASWPKNNNNTRSSCLLQLLTLWFWTPEAHTRLHP